MFDYLATEGFADALSTVRAIQRLTIAATRLSRAERTTTIDHYCGQWWDLRSPLRVSCIRSSIHQGSESIYIAGSSQLGAFPQPCKSLLQPRTHVDKKHGTAHAVQRVRNSIEKRQHWMHKRFHLVLYNHLRLRRISTNWTCGAGEKDRLQATLADLGRVRPSTPGFECLVLA